MARNTAPAAASSAALAVKIAASSDFRLRSIRSSAPARRTSSAGRRFLRAELRQFGSQDRLLAFAAQAARDAPPRDVLLELDALARVGLAFGVDFPELVDARGVAVRAEAGAEKEARHDQPRLLVIGGFGAARRSTRKARATASGSARRSSWPFGMPRIFSRCLSSVVGGELFVTRQLVRGKTTRCARARIPAWRHRRRGRLPPQAWLLAARLRPPARAGAG